MPDTQQHIARQAQKVSESAAHLEDSASAITQSADRTTILAANRTILAAERTYAAWVRTGLAALASGVGARTLLANVLADWFVSLTSSVLILFSAFCFMAAVWRELRPGASPPEPDLRRLPTWLLLSVNGFLVLVAIAALVSVWLISV
jgi:putative membrane protein